MTLLEDEATATAALLGISAQNGQATQTQDGAPTAQGSPTGRFPPIPRVGTKPRLLEKLPGSKKISNATRELMEKAKTDEDTQEDIKEMLVGPSNQLFTV